MSRLSCSYGKLIEVLTRNGFVLHRHDGGSHRVYRGVIEGQVRLVVVAMHRAADDVPLGTLRSMIRQSGLSPTLFR